MDLSFSAGPCSRWRPPWPAPLLRDLRCGQGGRAWLWGTRPGPWPQEALSAKPASEAARRLGRRGAASGAAGHAAAGAATGLPPPPRPGQKGAGRASCRARRPQRLGPTPGRTSDARPGPHFKALTTSRPPARRPPAPLLLQRTARAHAQYSRPPRLRAHRACACVRPGQRRGRAHAQTKAARRSPPLPTH